MHDLDSVENILVLAPNWLGDAAMATPVFRALKQRFITAHITVAGRSAVCDLLEGISSIDAFMETPARLSWSEMGRFVPSQAKFDLAILLPHSFRAGLFAWRLGAKRRVGYARGGRALLLTDAVPPYRKEGRIAPVYMSFEYMALISKLGCTGDGLGLELKASQAALDEVRSMLPAKNPVVGIAPGAAFGPSKQWMPERFAAVADALAEKADARWILITGPGEEKVRDSVLAAAQSKPLEISGSITGIARLKALIACVDLFVGNDSGPRHIAVAFDKPVICVMGSTKPDYSCGPWEKGEIVRISVDCGPCQKPACHTDHRCMTGISSEMVLKAALKWLPSGTALD